MVDWPMDKDMDSDHYEELYRRAKEIDEDNINEIVLRVAVRSHDRNAIKRFGQEIAPLILTGPPSVTGFAGGRPKPSDVVAYWPALIPKNLVTPQVRILNLS